MKTDVGSIDRILRIVVGLALTGATLSGENGARGWVGLAALLLTPEPLGPARRGAAVTAQKKPSEPANLRSGRQR